MHASFCESHHDLYIHPEGNGHGKTVVTFLSCFLLMSSTPSLFSSFQELYVVLEIADSDFKKLFRTPVYLTELHIKTLLYNLLVGVKYVHSAGILHRDLVRTDFFLAILLPLASRSLAFLFFLPLCFIQREEEEIFLFLG